MKGRKPKPTALRKLQGNPSGRKLNEDEPQFSLITKVEAPEWMGDLAKTMWETIMPELLANKILTVPDLHNVESFCMAYQRWRQAEAIVDKEGVVISTTHGDGKKHPALTVVNESKTQMMKLGCLLGLDPSSRTRLRGKADDKNPTNPFADL